MNQGSPSKILLIAELEELGTPSRATFTAASLAASLAKELSCMWSTLVFCRDPAMHSLLNVMGCTEVFECSIDPSHCRLAEYLAPTACKLVRERQIEYVVGPSTSLGKDLLPRVAGCLDAAYVGDCSGFRVEDGAPSFLRSIHAGHVSVECRSKSRSVVLAARETAFDPIRALHEPCPNVKVEFVTPKPSAGHIEVIGLERSHAGRPSLTEARVVVSGGSPLGASFFRVLAPLADQFNAALGATRALCDMGHAPAHLQVGQTGRVVAPDLYFAIGISGSVQHVAGMRDSKLVIAINRDTHAPIFAVADFGIVGDLFKLVPEITQAISRRRGSD